MQECLSFMMLIHAIAHGDVNDEREYLKVKFIGWKGIGIFYA